MKHLKLTALLPLLFFVSTAFRPAASGDEVLVTIDGKEILPEGTLEFKKDDDVWLEAVGLRPNSKVHFDLRKAGIKWMEYDYDVDETGTVKGVVGIPDNRIAAQCEVSYQTATMERETVSFRIKVR